MLAAFVLVALVLAVGGAVDFYRRGAAAAEIQEAADAAVLAAAAFQGDAAAKQAKADQIFAANLAGKYPGAALALDIDAPRYAGAVDYGLKTTLLKIVQKNSLAIRIDAVAMAQTRDTCVLALDPSAPQSVFADSNAQIAAPDCDIRVNSSDAAAVTALSNSHISAAQTCSTGAYAGSDLRYTPVPETACSVFPDPLAGLAAPPAAGCDETNLVIDNQTLTLAPGVYCGGVSIKNNSDVTFSPGVYVMKNGPLHADSNGAIAGAGVMVYLTGPGAILFFDSNSSVELEAPDSGLYEGVLFFEDRAQTPNLEHKIFSNNVSKLTGVVYLSQGHLKLDSNSVVGAASPWLALIVRRLTALSNVQLVVNADYDGASIGRPQGLMAGEVRLVQ